MRVHATRVQFLGRPSKPSQAGAVEETVSKKDATSEDVVEDDIPF